MRSKFGVLVGLLALLAAFVMMGGSSASAGPVQPAQVWPGSNYQHPFSQPIWFPIHTPIRIGCVGSSTNNNGGPCNADHPGYFAINFSVPKYLPNNQLNPTLNPHIFSAGAGVVIKVVTGQGCNTGSSVLPGNVVYVNHGGGTVAVYQHLNYVHVHVGDYVSQLTWLGDMGSSGAPCVNGKPAPAYMDFQIRKWGGTAALTNDISFLLGCVGTTTTAEQWPAKLTADQYYVSAPPNPLPTSWLKVPFGIGIATNPSWNCVAKTGGAGSLNQMTGTKMTRSSSTVHTFSWPLVTGAKAYSIELQLKKGSTWTVPCSPFVTKGCTYGFIQLGATTNHYVINGAGPYRARISDYNGVGWSAPTPFLVTS